MLTNLSIPLCVILALIPWWSKAETNEQSIANQSLLAAVQRGDVTAVKRALALPETLKYELNPECPPRTRCKPITVAAERGDLTILKLLLDAGADPNGTTWVGDTPLIIALMNGKREAVNLLLEYKADVNQINKFGTSAFMGACMMGDEDIVAMLLANGADVNKTFSFANPATHTVHVKTTPLSAAIQLKNMEVVRLLLKQKADVSIKDGLGKNAIDYAKESNNSEIFKIFNLSQ